MSMDDLQDRIDMAERNIQENNCHRDHDRTGMRHMCTRTSDYESGHVVNKDRGSEKIIIPISVECNCSENNHQIRDRVCINRHITESAKRQKRDSRHHCVPSVTNSDSYTHYHNTAHSPEAATDPFPIKQLLPLGFVDDHMDDSDVNVNGACDLAPSADTDVRVGCQLDPDDPVRGTMWCNDSLRKRGSVLLGTPGGRRAHCVLSVYCNSYDGYAVVSQDNLISRDCGYLSLKHCRLLPDPETDSFQIISDHSEGQSLVFTVPGSSDLHNWITCLQNILHTLKERNSYSRCLRPSKLNDRQRCGSPQRPHLPVLNEVISEE